MLGESGYDVSVEDEQLALSLCSCSFTDILWGLLISCHGAQASLFAKPDHSRFSVIHRLFVLQELGLGDFGVMTQTRGNAIESLEKVQY